MSNIKNVVSSKEGFVSSKAENVSFEIEHLKGENNRVLSVNSIGTVLTSSIALLTKYEFHQYNGIQIINSSSNFQQVFIDNSYDNVSNGLSLWNTQLSSFNPTELNSVYTIRFSGEIEPIGGNPVLHIDFVLSGSDPSELNNFRHHQSYELLIRNSSPHIHVLSNFTIFTDQDLLTSGAIIMATSTGANLTLNSASIFIKEG